MPTYAIIQTGGKQYRVRPGDVIDVEKLDEEVGARVALAEVLLVGGDGDVAVGAPTVDGARVTAEVAEQFRGPKIIVYKYKAKTHYRRKNGHRQSYTRLRIRHILTDGAEEPEEDVPVAVAAPVEAEAPVDAAEESAEDAPAEEADATEDAPADEADATADEAAADEPEAPAEEAPADEDAAPEADAEKQA